MLTHAGIQNPARVDNPKINPGFDKPGFPHSFCGN